MFFTCNTELICAIKKVLTMLTLNLVSAKCQLGSPISWIEAGFSRKDLQASMSFSKFLEGIKIIFFHDRINMRYQKSIDYVNIKFGFGQMPTLESHFSNCSWIVKKVAACYNQ